jgi:DNA repair exonuclease SbcCD ATPase subunit
MYKIYPKDKSLDYCYIGHTNNFEFRKKHHMLPCLNVSHTKSHIKLYQVIRENGGWDEWEMIELEKLNGKTKLEARMREQELIKQHNANLNMLSAFITEDERKEKKKVITQKYREENKELIREQEKKYKEDHKEIIAEQMKKYREENKEKIREKSKEYKEKNKEKFEEWDKDWREKNKEILKEKRKIYEAKKKEEKLLTQPAKVVMTEEEKEAIKKQKRDLYNENRRVKRHEESLAKSKATVITAAAAEQTAL